MTKHLRFLFIALLMAVWTGAWAQTNSKSVVCTLGKDAASCKSTGDCAVTWKYSSDPTTTDQTKNGMYWAVKPSAPVTLTATLSESGAVINSISIVAYTNRGTGKTVTIKVGGTQYDKAISLTKTSSTYTIKGESSGDVTLLLTSTTDTKSHIIKTVTINYTPASTKTTTYTTFGDNSKKKFTFVNGVLDGFEAPQATVTPTEAQSEIEYWSDNEDVVKVGTNGTLTFGTVFDTEAKIYAGIKDGNETYEASSDYYTVINTSNLKDPELAFNPATIDFDVNNIEFKSADHLTNPYTVAVKYSITPTSENAKIDENTGVAQIYEPGEYTITAKFEGNDTYKPATATCKLVVTDGKVVFYESFNKCDGKGGNDGQFKGTGSLDAKYDITGWTEAKTNAAAQCIKIGSGSYGGNVTSPSITINKVAQLTFNIASWSGDKSNVTITINNGTLGYNGSFAKSFTLTPSDSKFDNVEMIVKASSPFTIDFSCSDGEQRFFLDEVKVTEIKAKDYIFYETSDNNIVESYENANVTLKRSTLVTGSWNTFCVPFAISAEEINTTWGEGTQLRTFDSMSGTSTMNFKSAESIEAGKPYLVKPANTTTGDLTFNGVQTVADAKKNNRVGEGQFYMVGTYNAIQLAEDGSRLFLSTNNEFKKPQQNSAKMKGMRVYFEVPANTKPAELRANIDGVETGINAINGIEGNTTAPVYNLQGQCVGNSLRSLAPGIYVQGGKKYVVK